MEKVILLILSTIHFLQSAMVWKTDRTCLTLFFEDETLKMPTVCIPNCSRWRMHIITTVGTQRLPNELETNENVSVNKITNQYVDLSWMDGFL